MSPVAPMPQAAWVGTNGLNACVIVLSGELSITRVCDPLEFAEFAAGLDEHAPSPAARTPTAATVNRVEWLCGLLIISSSCPCKANRPTMSRGGGMRG